MTNKNLRFVVADTETTGFPPCMPVEIALVEVDENLNILNKWYSLIDPERLIEPGAQAIHGISADMVKDSPTSAEFVEHVLGGPLQGDICFIAHNRKFDQPMLEHIGNITHGICTLELARSLVRDSANHKLQTLREHFGIAANKAHSAMGDVEVTIEVLRNLLRLSGRTLQHHALTTKAVVHVMPFGLHKGKPLRNLPMQYIKYMLTLSDLDKNLRDSLITARNMK